MATFKDDKFKLAFGTEEAPFQCYENGHRTERDTHFLRCVVLGGWLGRFCIDHWLEATEEFEWLRKDRPDEVSADDVKKATALVKSKYEAIKGPKTWPGQ